MSREGQAMCFFAGANSIFVGDTLLTADNPEEDKDQILFDKLGITAMGVGSDGSHDAVQANTCPGSPAETREEASV